MIPKLSFWQGLGCTVLVMIGQTVALAGGRPGGVPQGGMKAKLPANVQRSIPAQQMVTKHHSLGSPSNGFHVISGTHQNLGTARKLPSGISHGTPISGKLPGVVLNPPAGGGIGARTKPGPLNPGVIKHPIGGTVFPPIVGGGTTHGGGGTNPPSGGGTTPPAGGGSTPPSGGSNPPSHNHHHCHFPNWWWVTPALYPRCGTVYGNYYLPTTSVVNVSSTPLVITTTSIEDSITVAAERLTLQLGESYNLKNENFGDAAGQIVLELNGLMLPALVTSWDAQTIAFTLPNLGLSQSRDGVLHVLKADQSVAKSVAVNVIAAQK